MNKSKKSFDLNWGVKIPLRDGIHLHATLYLPEKCKEPLPVIFTLTPYVADRYHEFAAYFSRNDYIFAIVDCRGRGNSEGVFEPLVKEDQDGYDTVEWFSAQPWCSGQVAMWGGSYMGFNQWATLKEFPPHLTTIIPLVSGYPGYDFPARYNIFMTNMMHWVLLTGGVTPNNNLGADSAFWESKFFQMYKDHRPLKELDRIVDKENKTFQTWVRNGKPGPYWDKVLPTAEDYARMSLPILTVTGQYDGDQPGALQFYKEHMLYGNQEAKEKHYLVIGPWDHGGSARPRKEIGGLTFGDASLVDMNGLQKQWYDWVMKEGEKPDFLMKRVAYYAAGAEAWKYANSLEEVGEEKQRLYLSSAGGRANGVFHSGTLTTDLPHASKPDEFVYDPRDIRPGELEMKPHGAPLTDQTQALSLFGNGLVYHTHPFEKAVEISGFPRLEAWVEMDVPDTDFGVLLYEIQPDGGSIQLSYTLMRARHRDSLRVEKLVTPGEITHYVFDRFTFFSRRIQKGSRLRLLFKCINSLDYEKNYNSGGIVYDENGADAHTAHIKLHHDLRHPSFLEIPIEN